MSIETGQGGAPNPQDAKLAESKNPDAKEPGGAEAQKKKATTIEESKQVDLTEFYRRAYNDGTGALMKRAQCEAEDDLLRLVAQGREADGAKEKQQKQADTLEAVQEQLKKITAEKANAEATLKERDAAINAARLKSAVEPVFAKAAKPRLAQLDYFDQFEVRLDEKGQPGVYTKSGVPVFGANGQPVTLEDHAKDWLNKHPEHYAAPDTSGSGAGGGIGGGKKETGSWDDLATEAKKSFGNQF